MRVKFLLFHFHFIIKSEKKLLRMYQLFQQPIHFKFLILCLKINNFFFNNKEHQTPESELENVIKYLRKII